MILRRIGILSLGKFLCFLYGLRGSYLAPWYRSPRCSGQP